MDAQDHKNTASRILSGYFSQALHGKWDFKNSSEIDDAISHIVDAAVSELVEQIRSGLAARKEPTP